MKLSMPALRGLFIAITLAFLSVNAWAIGVGDPAPDFELESTKGDKVKLSGLRGKTVLLTFYVLDFSATWVSCLQASGSDANYAKLKAENTEVFGIAASTRFAQKAFADFAKIEYPLLTSGTDITGVHKVMRDFGVFDEQRLLAKRSYIIIDKNGIIRYYDIRPTNTAKDLLTTEQLLAAVKKVNEGK